MNYLGDFVEDAVVRVLFPTRDGAGGATGFSGTLEAADFQVYKDGGLTEITVGISTPVSAFDSVTGLYYVEVDMSADAGYTPGSDYALVLSPDETLDGQTVVAVVATWSCENRFSDMQAIAGNKDAATVLASNLGALHSGTAQAGAAGSITLATAASSTNDFYNGNQVFITGGAGAGQAPRIIVDYIGSTRQALVDPSWAVTPDATSEVIILPSAPAPADTANLPNVVAASLAAQARAEVNTQVDAAIETYHLDHLLAAAYSPSSPPGAATALLNRIIENDGGVPRFTSNALEAAFPGIADAVWDELQADHTDAGTFGEVAEETAAIQAVTDALPDAGALSSIASAATLAAVGTNVSAIRDVTDAQGGAIIGGSVVAGNLTTTTCNSDVTTLSNDEIIGRMITFFSDASGCPGFQAQITDYASATGLITWADAASAAPQVGDGFVIS